MPLRYLLLSELQYAPYLQTEKNSEFNLKEWGLDCMHRIEALLTVATVLMFTVKHLSETFLI